MLQIYTGNGKGKTTAAIGQGIRACGNGLNVIMIQFLKTSSSGELNILKNIDNFTVKRFEKTKGFVWNLNEEEKKIINVLKNGITHINKIAAETGYPTGKVTAVASLLEIRGLIYSVTGNAYGLTDPQVWNSGESRI